MEIDFIFRKTFLYAKNKYNNGDGTYEVLSIDDLAFENINEPYYNSDTTFVFQPSDYTPISILSQDNIDNWDSLKHFDLIVSLEEEFDIVFPVEEIGYMVSFKLIKVVVEEQLKIK